MEDGSIVADAGNACWLSTTGSLAANFELMLEFKAGSMTNSDRRSCGHPLRPESLRPARTRCYGVNIARADNAFPTDGIDPMQESYCS